MREWLLRDPLASWRRLIDMLYHYNKAERANSILHYAEELIGMYMIMIMIHITLHHIMHGKCTRESLNIISIQISAKTCIGMHSCQPPEFTGRDMLLYACATPTSRPTPTSKFSNKTKIMGVVEIWIVSLAALS